MRSIPYLFFFFNDTATTEIYTLSLHDALPICVVAVDVAHAPLRELLVALLHLPDGPLQGVRGLLRLGDDGRDRKSTRLNSSHANISYAVFCLKKKKINICRARIFQHSHYTPMY